jgi:hypothetical protein
MGAFGPTTSLAVLPIFPEGRTREKSRGYMTGPVLPKLKSSERKRNAALLHNKGYRFLSKFIRNTFRQKNLGPHKKYLLKNSISSVSQHERHFRLGRSTAGQRGRCGNLWIAIVQNADSPTLLDDPGVALQSARRKRRAAMPRRFCSGLHARISKLISTNYRSRVPSDYCASGKLARSVRGATEPI